MKKYLLVAFAIFVVTMAASAQKPDPDKRDTTLLRPNVDFTIDGNILHVRGKFDVVNPVNDGRDHDVAIRFVFDVPDDKVVHGKHIRQFRYTQNHRVGDSYRCDMDINMEPLGITWTKGVGFFAIDKNGKPPVRLRAKVVAVDLDPKDKRELGSVCLY